MKENKAKVHEWAHISLRDVRTSEKTIASMKRSPTERQDMWHLHQVCTGSTSKSKTQNPKNYPKLDEGHRAEQK